MGSWRVAGGVIAVASFVLHCVWWPTPTTVLHGLDPTTLSLLPPGSRREALVRTDGTLLPLLTGPSSDGAPPFEVSDARVIVRRPGQPLTVPEVSLQHAAEGGLRREPLFFPLGTDALGRDLLDRLIFGARSSLGVALMGVGGAALLAALIGLGAAVAPRPISRLLQRIGDTLLALPLLLIALAIAQRFQPGPVGLAAILALTGWPAMARLVRAEVIALLGSDLWSAACAIGTPVPRAALRHLLPHAIGVLTIAAGLRVGQFLLLESALSFVGFGIAAPEPSWGNILADGRGVLMRAWWVAVFPGLSIGLTVLGANAVADRVRRRQEARLH